MEHLEPRYVTGLCDGAAAFTFSRNGNSPAALYFAVKLNAADGPLLRRLQDYFEGAGKIYDVKPRVPKANSGWTKKSVYYRITHLKDIAVVVEHFDRYPLQGRRHDAYLVWKQLYELRVRFWRKAWPDDARLQFDTLLEQLSGLSPRNRRWDG